MKKTYVLMLAKNFPVSHPKAWSPTGFREKFLSGNKLHTIRANFPLWVKRVREVQEGKAVLSIRQWEGRPYLSRQVIIGCLTAESGIGIQKLRFSLTGTDVLLSTFSTSTGTIQNFRHWPETTVCQ